MKALALACLVGLSVQSPMPGDAARQAAAVEKTLQLAPLGSENTSDLTKRDTTAAQQKPNAPTGAAPQPAEAEHEKREATDGSKSAADEPQAEKQANQGEEPQQERRQRLATEEERREALEAVELAKRATGGVEPKEVIIEEE